MPESTGLGKFVAEVVTGEAVVIDVPCARFPSRAVALAIDLLVQPNLPLNFTPFQFHGLWLEVITTPPAAPLLLTA